ncbi:glycosyltransferase [Petroclostridium sp. X23]|uniref:glycosyltransferase n=1 Tax=Petroclostridium sp. X23 TaxID=3045146 RepID=UPI0024AD358E|nr:glycosyltransferase [Petroclostridium sp. X23]WHH58357.1 glycosyltransferase [Petroclostridium sp. X23]
MKTVAVVADRFILDVRTYIYEEITAMKKYNILVLTKRRENSHIYPFKNVYECKNKENPMKEYVNMIKKQKARLIHIKFGNDALQYIKLKRITGLPLVVSFHGYDASGALKNPWILHKYKKELFPNTDHIVTVSQKLKDNLAAAGCPSNKITVLWSGIDLEKFYYKPRTLNNGEAVRILSVARLTEAKGLKYLIEAFEKIVKIKPDIELSIVGNGPLKKELKKQISDLKLNQKVKIYDFISPHKIPDVMNDHHIFCLPSIVASNGIEEGTPNVLKEACASGMPVVATSHSGIPHVINNGKNGFLVNEKDTEQLAQSLIYLIEHSEIWESMSQWGRSHIEENFDKIKQAEKIEKIYADLIKKSKRGH